MSWPRRSRRPPSPRVTRTRVSNLSPQIAGQQEAAEVIAPALVSSDGADLPASQADAILSGFAQQGYLQVSPSKGYTAATLSQATLAVVVIPRQRAGVGRLGPGQPGAAGPRRAAQAAEPRSCPRWLASRVRVRQRHRRAHQRQHRDPGVQRGQRQHRGRPDHGRPGLQLPAGREEAGRIRRLRRQGPEPGAHPVPDAVVHPVAHVVDQAQERGVSRQPSQRRAYPAGRRAGRGGCPRRLRRAEPAAARRPEGLGTGPTIAASR